MAALPYIQLYIADYLADTMHLQAEEHGAYLLLIFNYWQTGKAIPKNRLRAIARVSNERWADVERTLSEFFNDTGTHWQHGRIDEDLLKVSDKQSGASKAGKASAAARKAKKQEESQRALNERSTNVGKAFQQNSNHTDTDTEYNIVSSVPEEDNQCVFDVSEKPEDQSEEEKPKRNNYPADFNTFFQAFPHKEGVSKKKAFEAWKRARDKPDLQAMLAIIEILRRSEQWQRGFIPHASTWLNGKCWETVGDKSTVIHNHFEEISGDLPVWIDRP